MAAPEAPQAKAADKLEKVPMAPEYIQEPGKGLGIYQVRGGVCARLRCSAGGAGGGGRSPAWDAHALLHASGSSTARAAARQPRPRIPRSQPCYSAAAPRLASPLAAPSSVSNPPSHPLQQGTDGYLYCDGLRIDDIRAQVGPSGPFYLYSQERIR